MLRTPLLFVMLMSWMACSAELSPEDTARAFERSLELRNWNDAYVLLDANSQQWYEQMATNWRGRNAGLERLMGRAPGDTTGASTFAAMMSFGLTLTTPERTPSSHDWFGSASIEGDVALVPARTAEHADVVELVREAGRWRMKFKKP